MGRPKGKDRGLVLRKTVAGVRFWRVRLVHEGRDVTFQPFWEKRAALAFYRKCKALQAANQFNPKDFQKSTGKKSEGVRS